MFHVSRHHNGKRVYLVRSLLLFESTPHLPLSIPLQFPDYSLIRRVLCQASFSGSKLRMTSRLF